MFQSKCHTTHCYYTLTTMWIIEEITLILSQTTSSKAKRPRGTASRPPAKASRPTGWEPLLQTVGTYE